MPSRLSFCNKTNTDSFIELAHYLNYPGHLEAMGISSLMKGATEKPIKGSNGVKREL